MKNDIWIRTFTGGKCYFFDPELSNITIEDIAHGLSLTCRFNGAVNQFYSVAQHCCLICDALDEYKFEGLMHDSSEAFLSDVPKPFKDFFKGYKESEKRFEVWLAEMFNFAFPYPAIVKEYDTRMLVTEMRDLMNVNDAKNIKNTKPFDKIIQPWGWKKSKREFLNRYHKHRPNICYKKSKNFTYLKNQ